MTRRFRTYTQSQIAKAVNSARAQTNWRDWQAVRDQVEKEAG